MKIKILLSLVVSILLSATHGQYDHYLYFTDQDAMTTRYLDVEDPSTIIDFPFNNLIKPYGMLADTVHNYLFVSDAIAGKIYRYNFEGTHALTILDVLIDPVVGRPYGLAIVGDKLYWAREGAICKANIDGSNPVIWLHLASSYPPEMALGLAFNPDDSMMYFTNDKVEFSGGIYRVHMDGLGLEMLEIDTYAAALAIDWVHDKLYYYDHTKGICMNDYGGGDETIIDNQYGDALVWGMTVDMYGGKIYYTDNFNDKIIQEGLDGSNKTDFATGVDAYALAWYSSDLTALPEEPEVSEAEIYPNPAVDYIHIKNATAYDRLVITNLSGQLVDQYELTADAIKIPTEGFEKGVYIISLLSKKSTHSQKIVIQ
jgi:hypothetical protein